VSKLGDHSCWDKFYELFLDQEELTDERREELDKEIDCDSCWQIFADFEAAILEQLYLFGCL